MYKKILSILLATALLLLPLSGLQLMDMTVTAANTTFAAPNVAVNVAPFGSVHPNDWVTVTYTDVQSCETRLEGTVIGTTQTVSFTPSSKHLADGMYTLVMEMVAADGTVRFETLTFRVDSNAEITPDDTTAAVSTFAVQALDFTAGYASSSDGTIDLSKVQSYGAAEQYALRYAAEATAASSVSGIPYQVFDIALGSKTDGTVNVHYSGATKRGERMVVKAYNVRNGVWDTIGGFIGEGYVSEELNVTLYNDNGVIHVAAMLDYAFNGSDTMLWSTDPQHYTKFEDLHEYYYRIYEYAAEQYTAGKAGYIITTGDLVDDLPTASVTPHQWDVSDTAMQYVEAVGMPNGLVSGNHDVGTFNATDYSAGPNTKADYSHFYKHYPATRYNRKNWYGGSLNNNVSHYDLITIGNVDFIVMYLGYGLEATDETIAWANDVLATYRHRTAIIATHEYLDATAATYSNRGQLIYNTIVNPNPNVKMVLCGHDDGALCVEKTASDGRTVYEVLSDYQFMEAEDPSFYANEHWIGSVPECCGDGYLRLMTVRGETLTSVTYSPVTGRYNPFGDRENLTLDLDCGMPDRAFSTACFSAAVIGAQTDSQAVDRVRVLTKDGRTSYGAVIYAVVPSAPAAADTIVWPTTTYGVAATPSAPYYAHAAKQAPAVTDKVDVLQAAGLDAHPTPTKMITFGGSLNLKIDLNKTPYLYYSFAVPQGSSLTFAFLNNSNYSPWLTFLDATKGGTTLNSGADNWNAYADNGAQYFTGSATGCIDMRKLAAGDASTWIVNQLNFYNKTGNPATVSYLFFGSAPSGSAVVSYGEAAVPADPYHAHVAAQAPQVANKKDVLSAVGLTNDYTVSASANYSGTIAVDLNKTPYLYYSFEVPADGSFTFALIANTNYSQWINFLDTRLGGDTLNMGTDRWNASGGKQYMTVSSTGCIDMRTLPKDPYGMYMEIRQLNLYNPSGKAVKLKYMFFGSTSFDSDDGVSMDAAALETLIKKATAVDTAAYTAASTAALKTALNKAQVVNRSDVRRVAQAYHTLNNVLGALVPVKATIDESKLVSVKKYSMAYGDWVCNSTGAALTASNSYMTVSATAKGGMLLKYSSAAKHVWPHARYVGSGSSYTVNPYGGVYMKLDVNCPSGWAIALVVTQDGVTQNVRINAGLEHAHCDPAYDGMQGRYEGVYDISEAFTRYGFDPTATFTVSNVYLFVLGGAGAQVTYDHVELLTGKTTSANYTSLKKLITYAEQHTQSLYTSASWSTFKTALNAAKTKSTTSGLTQPAIELARFKLQKAIDGLVLKAGIEPNGSMLADDIGIWQAPTSGAATAWRDGNGDTVITNQNGTWAAMDHRFSDGRNITLRKYCIDVDITVDGAANILVLRDDTWVSLSPYITDQRNGEDMNAGNYRVKIPLTAVAEFADTDAVVLNSVRIYSIGESGKNAVTIRRLAIERYCDHRLSNTLTTYGPAATPKAPYAAHAAKNAPLVADKVDVLAALGLDHPTIKGNSSYGNNILKLTVDLNKTPYLYYSVVIPKGSNFTFAFYNDTTYAPWLTFLDATKGATTMNNGADAWNAYTNGAQYMTTSVTACIDMRKLTNSSDITTWVARTINFYNNSGDGAIISYMFFGSEALSDGYEEEEITQKGDVDFDGKASTVDARLMLQAMLGLEELTALQKEAGDMDDDGDVDTTDIRLLLQSVLLG